MVQACVLRGTGFAQWAGRFRRDVSWFEERCVWDMFLAFRKGLLVKGLGRAIMHYQNTIALSAHNEPLGGCWAGEGPRLQLGPHRPLFWTQELVAFYLTFRNHVSGGRSSC